MKRLFLFLTVITLALTTSCQQSIHTRVMSYNVRNCTGLDGEHSPQRIANIITAENVEAVALQELDSMTMRYPGEDVLGKLAELTGMYPTFGASIDFQGGKYGIGILTKEKPISWQRVPLPCRAEPRSLLIVELEDYYFCSTHLSLHAEDRNSSASKILFELSKLDKPVIIAGDFNATPDEESIKHLTEGFHFVSSPTKLTFPADKPEIEIDYIGVMRKFATEIEEVETYVAEATVESDHRPLVSEIDFKKR
ncbi:MAG: endonuclease/exonuclease/phosphatase family protein [Alistipes sp.]|nr:endonuclease/exonuclease/phosphatase family protein [Alistipes sp.]